MEAPRSLASEPAEDGATAEVWDREHRSLTIGLLLTVSFTAFEAMAVTTVLPATVAELGRLDLYGWAFSGFVLASMVGITLAGHSADRRGAALPFASGAALFVAGLLGAGIAATMPLLVAARVLQGLGGGALSAVAYAAVGRGYGSGARARMIALLSTAWVLPGLAGPAIAGAVADFVGWRWVFLGLAPPTVIAAWLAFGSLRRLGRNDGTDGAAAGRKGSDLRLAAILLALGTGTFLSGLDGSAGVAGAVPALAGLVLAIGAVRRLLPAGTLRAREGSPAAVAIMAILGFAFFGAEAFVPLALTDVRGLPATLAGLPLTVAALAWTGGAWLQDREASRRSHRLLIGAGLTAIVAGTAGVATVLVPAVPAWTTGPWWALAAFGMGLAYSTTALAILEGATPGKEGEASAALQLANMLGTALGAGLGGALLDAVTRAGFELSRGIAAVDLMTGAVALLGVLLARRVPPGRRRPA